MAERTTVKGNAFNDPNDMYDLQATPVPIAWLYQLHNVLLNHTNPAVRTQAQWLLEDVTQLLFKLNGPDAFYDPPTYLYSVTMQTADGTIHQEDLIGVDDSHAKEEAECLWLDETCIAVQRGDKQPEDPIKRIIWVK